MVQRVVDAFWLSVQPLSESWSPHSQVISNSDLQAKFGLVFNLGLVNLHYVRLNKPKLKTNFALQTCGYMNVWHTHPNLSAGPNQGDYQLLYMLKP